MAQTSQSVAQIVSETLQNVTHSQAYRQIKANIIQGLSNIALDPDRYLSSNKDDYVFMCKDSDTVISTDLVIRLLFKEAFLEYAWINGYLTTQTRTNGEIWLAFDKGYIDSLIKAATIK